MTKEQGCRGNENRDRLTTITEKNIMNLRLLPALGVALAAFVFASGGARVAITDEDVANLTRRTAEANSALMRGDIDGYLALTSTRRTTH
jgi:hypothetical protein